jgi:CheY-like chemotaxis protein
LVRDTMKERILVVDDNPDSIAIIRSILEAFDFSVQAAESGAEALEMLKGDLPNVVLLDVMMPEMSGLDVLEQIKANPATKKLPVVLVTAKTQDEDVLAGYQYGADYYITKPCTSKQLLYAIGLVLGKADLTREGEEGGTGGDGKVVG